MALRVVNHAQGDGQAPEADSGRVLNYRTGVLTEKYTMPATELGHGHYGTVRVGINKATSDAVAVKTIPKSKVRSLQMLRNEIDIMRLVNDPTIIKLHEVYETRKYIHLILSHLQGGDLFERIKTKSLYKESDAIPIMRDLLSGLDHLHSQLIMHRDLKPESLIFAEQDDNSVL